jgi:hypothetical protein
MDGRSCPFAPSSLGCEPGLCLLPLENVAPVQGAKTRGSGSCVQHMEYAEAWRKVEILGRLLAPIFAVCLPMHPLPLPAACCTNY